MYIRKVHLRILTTGNTNKTKFTDAQQCRPEPQHFNDWATKNTHFFQINVAQ